MVLDFFFFLLLEVIDYPHISKKTDYFLISRADILKRGTAHPGARESKPGLPESEIQARSTGAARVTYKLQTKH